LVAGAPQSFIQQLSQPYYSRRPVVPLPESVQLEPQTHAATLIPGNGTLTGTVTDPSGADVAGATVRVYDASNNLVATVTTDESGDYEASGLPEGNYRIEVQQTGFQQLVANNVAINGGEETTENMKLGIGGSTEMIEVQAAAPPPAAPGAMANRAVSTFALMQPGVVASARAAQQAAAQARELGDLFEYKLKQPVTIRKNQSALVPILQSDVAAEKVSLWSEAAGRPQPLLAVWLTNTSGLTLDGGSFTVLEEETF